MNIHQHARTTPRSRDLLVQRVYRIAGHCAFSQPEMTKAFDDLVGWVRRNAKPEGDDVLGDPVQTQRELRDHRQRALRADQQARQVVARGRLRRPAAGADHAPVREHGLEREHVRAHLPVPHRRRARGVRRRHSAERRVGTRVDGEEKAVLPGCPLDWVSRYMPLTNASMTVSRPTTMVKAMAVNRVMGQRTARLRRL